MSTKRARATDAEIAARVQEVLTCRLNGASFHDLQALAAEKGWDVSDRQLWRYVQLADRQMGEHFEEDRATLLRRHVLQRRRIYAQALQDGELRTALAVLRDEGALLGLYGEPRAKGEAPAGPVKDTAGVVRVLGAQLERLASVEMTEGDRSRLTMGLADSLLRAMTLDTLAARLEALANVLAERKVKKAP